ncbi:MAG: phosphoribosylformylglycinamidine cyclo-ligase [Coriobacteriales bacterium]|jgi:phosphoribosylformylglycinamidine cyclo-ligase|nr:phosphoribosylformylglycinamidine cyclo-ligase [Coriobacteriales bacterium]
MKGNDADVDASRDVGQPVDSDTGLATAALPTPADVSTYAAAGVDIEEGARAVDAIRSAVHSTYTPQVIGDIGGFGGLLDASALKNMARPVLVSSTDGVGTKLELAKRLARHSTVGIDLVAMCVNDLVVSGAQPLFFLDYLAVGKLDADFAADVISGIAEGCRQAGCALLGGEMAEHPGVMLAGDYDLAGFSVGCVDCDQILGPIRVQKGDAIIGLASSGFHSNGYSLIRRAFSDHLSDAELQDTLLESGQSLAAALMAPTRIYVRELLGLVDSGLPVRAAAHITGGGITENLKRVLPQGLDALIDLDSWNVPELIRTVCATIGLAEAEALKTFNMGIGMILIVDSDSADAVMAAMSTDQDCWLIGSVIAADDSESAGIDSHFATITKPAGGRVRYQNSLSDWSDQALSLSPTPQADDTPATSSILPASEASQ